MSDHNHIDNYCERLDGGFWAEPINAITNLAFIIAAYFAYRFWRAKGAREPEILALTGVLALVGVGSFLFHTFASPLTLLADVLPILVFIHLAIYSAAYRVFGLGRVVSITIVIAFFAFTFVCEKIIPADILNGSMMYLPAFLALLTMTFLARLQVLQAHKAFLAATILFLISLTFRSVDMAICEASPAQIGTHFMWHILNGLLMFYVIKGLLLGDLRKT